LSSLLGGSSGGGSAIGGLLSAGSNITNKTTT